MIINMFGPAHSVGGLPEDLRRNLGEGDLLRLSRFAAEAVSAKLPSPAAARAAELDPLSMLVLVTYCYAAAIYPSKDVAEACHSDPMLKSLCAGNPPDWSAIWRFRNANRPWIEESLARAYEMACRLSPSDLAVGPDSHGKPVSNLTLFARRKLRLAASADAAMFE